MSVFLHYNPTSNDSSSTDILPRISEETWSLYRAKIYDRYIVNDEPLSAIIKWLREEHNFCPSEHQLTYRLSKWEFFKNSTSKRRERARSGSVRDLPTYGSPYPSIPDRKSWCETHQFADGLRWSCPFCSFLNSLPDYDKELNQNLFPPYNAEAVYPLLNVGLDVESAIVACGYWEGQCWTDAVSNDNFSEDASISETVSPSNASIASLHSILKQVRDQDACRSIEHHLSSAQWRQYLQDSKNAAIPPFLAEWKTTCFRTGFESRLRTKADSLSPKNSTQSSRSSSTSRGTIQASAEPDCRSLEVFFGTAQTEQARMIRLTRRNVRSDILFLRDRDFEEKMRSLLSQFPTVSQVKTPVHLRITHAVQPGDFTRLTVFELLALSTKLWYTQSFVCDDLTFSEDARLSFIQQIRNHHSWHPKLSLDEVLKERAHEASNLLVANYFSCHSSENRKLSFGSMAEERQAPSAFIQDPTLVNSPTPSQFSGWGSFKATRQCSHCAHHNHGSQGSSMSVDGQYGHMLPDFCRLSISDRNSNMRMSIDSWASKNSLKPIAEEPVKMHQAPLRQEWRSEIYPEANRTKISRKHITSEALQWARERFVEERDCFVVSRVLSEDRIWNIIEGYQQHKNSQRQNESPKHTSNSRKKRTR